MDELNKLEINNQKQIKKLDSLWHELADLKLQFVYIQNYKNRKKEIILIKNVMKIILHTQ